MGSRSFGALLLAAALAVVGCPEREPEEERGAPRPTPRPGTPARGASIAVDALDHHLPPPPRDAVKYEVRHPLNNGPTVPVKKRWVWIPDGTKIRLSAAGGRVAVTLPVGAMLWKEFYLETSGSRVDLVERRILRKVADRNQDNGWLLNGGWRFYTSHHLPPRADGKSGYDNDLIVSLGDADPYFFRPDRWMPTQAKGAATFLTVTGAGGARYPYVFPGKTQCTVCHDGAAGGYGNPEARPVLAFGPHPDNLTTASFRALAKRGWIDAPVALARRYSTPSPPPHDRTGRLVAVFRNNCLSCHNSSARSIGRDTAFVLQPGRDYTAETLRELFQRRSAVMGRLGLPVVAPGSPTGSELVLRLKGAAGRRRMPPAEGGLPDRDERLIKLASRWVAELGRR